MKTSFPTPATLCLTALSVLMGTLLSACNPAPTPVAEPAAPIIQNEQVRFAPGHPQLALLGYTAATAATSLKIDMPAKLVWNEENTQRIYAPFAGRVVAIHSDVGQTVNPGSVLAQLASPDFGMAQSDTSKAQADARLAERTLQRQRELFGAGIIARKDLEQAEADQARAQAELERAQARTKLYGSQGTVNQSLALHASIHGLVVERNINPGQELRPDLSGPGVPALFVVTDPSFLWIQIDARESELAVAAPGATFEITSASLPGELFTGTVVAVSDYIDPLTRTIKIRGLVANPKRLLKAEMLVTARFERKFNEGTVVPASAVQLIGTQHTAFVMTQEGVFERRTVAIMFESPKEVILRSGIKVGESVVVENSLLLARLLRIAEEEARAPADTKPAAIKTEAKEQAKK
jgi:cobalt-zinc-cadmium efflux system membrane fusion protein